jgi:Spy/CpxP family protein refolding chaperone
MKKLLLLLFMATVVAWAQPREYEDDDAPMGPMFGGGRFMEKLDLTVDQQKQFDKLRTDMQKKQIDLHAKIQTSRLDIKDLFNDDSPNKSAIELKMNEVSKLQNDTKLNHLNFWFEVNKILKPDQQKIWKEHRMMLGGGMGPWGGQGMKGGFGPRTGRHRGRGMGTQDCPPGCCK